MAADADHPTLDDVTHTLHGVAQLLAIVAHAATTPAGLGAGLQLLSTTLNSCVQTTQALVDAISPDLTQNLGISTTELAEMHFAPVSPPYARHPATLEAWSSRAQAEFTLWGAVEILLAQDDATLERRFQANPDEHLALVEALEKLRERWLGEVKLLETSLLRLAVVVARWEQSSPH